MVSQVRQGPIVSHDGNPQLPSHRWPMPGSHLLHWAGPTPIGVIALKQHHQKAAGQPTGHQRGRSDAAIMPAGGRPQPPESNYTFGEHHVGVRAHPRSQNRILTGNRLIKRITFDQPLIEFHCRDWRRHEGHTPSSRLRSGAPRQRRDCSTVANITARLREKQ